MSEKPKLKIGLVFDDSLDSSDGVAQYVKDLGGWLSGQGHEVSYLVGETKLTEWRGGKVYSLSKNQAVYFNGNRLSVPLPANSRRIRELLNAKNFDIMHVMVPYSPFLAQKIINVAALTTPIVGTFHIYPAGNLARLSGRLLKYAYLGSLSKFSKIVSVSSAAQSYASDVFGLQTAVIPNMVDISKFSQAKPVANHQPTVVFLGRLVKRKGCAQLLEAFTLLRQSKPNARLIIAGDGPQRQKLEALTSKLGIKDNVFFQGFIEESQKPALLGGADIACFPSLYGESFGIVLIEAMAAGAGVVLGGDNPGYRSVLAKQDQLLINPRDTADFAQRLQIFLDDKALTKNLHAWQLQTVKQYDVERVGEQIERLYRQAIAPAAKSRHN